MKKIKDYKELAAFLLYIPLLGGISVGIIGDTNISEDLEPKFREKLKRYLQKERINK